MKKKPKPREWWLVVTNWGTPLFAEPTLATARQWRADDPRFRRIVHVREVLPSLPKKKAKRT
jgi:hypothetical protein